MIPKKAGPEEARPKETGPEEAGPKEAEPKEAGTGETGPKEAGPKEARPKEAGPEEARPEEAGHKEEVKRENINRCTKPVITKEEESPGKEGDTREDEGSRNTYQAAPCFRYQAKEEEEPKYQAGEIHSEDAKLRNFG